MHRRKWLLPCVLVLMLGVGAPALGASVTPRSVGAAPRGLGKAVDQPADKRIHVRSHGDDQRRTGLAAVAPPARLKVLVMRTYWTARAPSAPSVETATDVVLTQAAAWFKRVSRGRETLTGKVTPWLKVRRGSCDGISSTMTKAKKKAKAKGYALARFNRYMVVMPQCGANSFGQLPGKDTWIREPLALGVVVHELGHNLGLGHANSRICELRTMRVTLGGSCSGQEYGDIWDAMGISDGSYSVPILSRLGWAGRTVAPSGSVTYTLAPVESSGNGLQGIRVRVSSRLSYWIEYRTNPKTPGFLDAVPGVQIRMMTTGRSMQLLDGQPGNPDPFLSFPDPDLANPALPVGGSFTSPERIRITTLSQTPRRPS